MKKRLRIISSLSIVLLLFVNTLALAEDGELDVLKRALTKALGEKTNWNSNRVLGVAKETISSKSTLVIVLNANNSPTSAGLRHAILKDITKVYRILKSWDWPAKVQVVMLTEQYPASNGEDKKLGLRFAISSAEIREIEWDSFDPKKIPEVAHVTELR